MNWHQAAGVVSGILASIGQVPYILGTWRGQIKPNRVTWWSLTFTAVVMAAGSIAAGAFSAAILPVCLLAGNGVMALLSIRCGVGGSTVRDRICIGIVIVSLLLWGVTANPNLAVAGTVIANLASFWPTLVNISADPQLESRAAWWWFWASSVVCLGAIDGRGLSHWLFPIYGFVLNNVVLYLFSRQPPQSNPGADA